ncbi:TetR/AcrR family transcriptional regulator [Mangrovitalea sediminis]|uniref:TetR/AcrR family transcriptional regulator n=1 Tax=Mangrovitalea sediminis TaxID=1982043 RepID=UPI000BE5F38A|nr:TetR/AcrR family transcriptional regulator [Mangrovitalea sediminis]
MAPKSDAESAVTSALVSANVRADAQRNADAVLSAAKEVFAEKGVDAPVRDIAAKAGVGIGTLYRRFPKRSDLIKAVFKQEVDACAATAADFSAQYSSMEALTRWLHRYTDFIAAKRGLSSALRSGDPAYDELPDYFRARFEPVLGELLRQASEVQEIRADIEAYDLLRAIGNLAAATGDGSADHTRRMVGLLVDGLRNPPRKGSNL